ncbi:MAG: right-handed parallel beta-helix repeat-containing protein [Gammaproteobacteria bacterium]|nr:right-handed parallel beta-helix repeat-containing protein [Nitrosopumilus sp.]MDH5594576.1 right-handed parallel beta-helix repeat-containing protein [Gammaproteobacteria bacterium]
MKRISHFFTLISIFVFFGTSQATTFCVDPSGAEGAGCDYVVQTITEVNDLLLSAGDSVLFKRGGSWYGALSMNSSGTAGNSIIFSSYGDPELPKPLLHGMVNVFGPEFTWKKSLEFSNPDQTVWVLKSGYSYGTGFSPYMGVLDDGITLDMRKSLPSANKDTAVFPNDGDFARVNFTQDHGSWTFYIRMDSATENLDGTANFGSYSFHIPNGFKTLIDTNGQSNIIIDGFELRGAFMAANVGAIMLNHSKNVEVKNNEVRFSRIGISTSYSKTYEAGVCFSESETIYDSISNTIESNIIHDNWESGIYLKGFSRDNKIIGNIIFDNYTKGQTTKDLLAIGLTGNLNCSFQRTNNEISHNEIFNNGTYGTLADSAISIYSAMNTSVVKNDIHDNNQGVFYFAHRADNSVFAYNKVYRNRVQNGFHLKFQGGNNLSISNNTIYGNQIEATVIPDGNYKSYRFIAVDGNAVNTKINNNIFMMNDMTSSTDYPVYMVWLLGESTLNNNIYFENTSSDLLGQAAPMYAIGSSWAGNGAYIVPSRAYTNLYDWQSGESQDVDSFIDNPNMQDTVNGKFELLQGSFAIDKGIDIGLATDFDGNIIIGLPDIGAFENQDPDNDGSNAVDDCNSGDSSIYPGAIEIKHDGVDQDCNGYDLTIDITLVQYLSSKKLKVWATSSLGENATLTLNSFGPMSWNSVSQRWEIVTDKLDQIPTEITVSGIEGEENTAFIQ